MNGRVLVMFATLSNICHIAVSLPLFSAEQTKSTPMSKSLLMHSRNFCFASLPFLKALPYLSLTDDM
jgi:hypothetical protein